MLNTVLVRALPLVPKPLVRRVALRYIAGETLEQALARARELATRGHPSILDVLGEHTTDPSQIRAAVDEYLVAIDRITELGLDMYVSAKPTHFGLAVSEELALDSYSRVAERGAERGVPVRVEMEDHTTTDATLRIFETLRDRFANVGIVLQSRLKRTPDDIAALAPGPLDVRMVKGVYLEPPSVAYTDREEIRDAYVRCTELLLERGARVAAATHDDLLIERLAALYESRGASRADLEIEVLLGVRDAIWPRWMELGHTVRVYIPFGPEWRPYTVRRMQENPEILRMVIRNMLTGGR